ncbi:MSMEG_0567/Sll0786 family nitrogen starvation N-acetyltransferase, partial [Herbidospora galbida]|uniref:MSMEG_0567/Sll0786 family nitrogen starvation N-acetyltransferase n=1 Tax=Herbidospora galbida TaxID=2575442 RepID=UPI001BAF533F
MTGVASVCDVLLTGSPGPAAARPLDVPALLGAGLIGREPARFVVEATADRGCLYAYRLLRRRVFVEEQGLFEDDDLDHRDEDPRTVVLVARDAAGVVLGGVRLGPEDDGPDIGWWRGSRLVVDPALRGAPGVGPALVRAACAFAEEAGVLRFEADVQERAVPLFTRLGWRPVRALRVAGRPHHTMRWPIGRLARAAAGKAAL